MLFASFPLTDQAGCNVKIASEDRLAGLLAPTEGADLFRGQRSHRRQAHDVKSPHGPFVHNTGVVEALGGLVDRGQQRVTIRSMPCRPSFSHGRSPRSMFRMRVLLVLLPRLA